MTRDLWMPWLVAAGITAAITLLGWILGRLLLRVVSRLARRTATDLDDAVVAAVKPHVAFWALILGVTVGVRFAHPDAAVLERVDRFAFAALLLSLTFAAASFLSRFVRVRAQRWPGALPSTTLTQNAVRMVVIALGLLVVLGNLGVAIAPLLTALGVGSLAVALALQPTLSNLFAGFHITLARRIRIGDFIELEAGQQGVVTDIGWRSTQIRELSNNLVIVPNARLAEVIVRNFSLPENEQAALVQVGVAYGSDLAEVERITVETAREIQRTIHGAVTSFDPFIRYHTFGDSSIDFTVILRVDQFVDRYLVMHEFLKRLHRRYAEAGIEIPFPQRVVHVAGTAPALP